MKKVKKGFLMILSAFLLSGTFGIVANGQPETRQPIAGPDGVTHTVEWGNIGARARATRTQNGVNNLTIWARLYRNGAFNREATARGNTTVTARTTENNQGGSFSSGWR